jgi:hypothetical protein
MSRNQRKLLFAATAFALGIGLQSLAIAGETKIQTQMQSDAQKATNGTLEDYAGPADQNSKNRGAERWQHRANRPAQADSRQHAKMI